MVSGVSEWMGFGVFGIPCDSSWHCIRLSVLVIAMHALISLHGLVALSSSNLASC